MEFYISSWSLRSLLRSPSDWHELPRMAKQNDFRGIEIMDRQIGHFPRGSLRQFARECRNANCAVILDVSSDFTLRDPGERQANREYVLSMLQTAQIFEANKIRILLGGQSLSVQKLFRKFQHRPPTERRTSDGYSKTEPVLQRALSGATVARVTHFLRRHTMAGPKPAAAQIHTAIHELQHILPSAAANGQHLLIENHWGISSHPEIILQIVQAVESPWLGVCADFDNFPRTVDVNSAFAQLLPQAGHVHAKSYGFRKNGHPQKLDLERFMRSMCEKQYEGGLTIEYMGRGNPWSGTRDTKEYLKNLLLHRL